MGRRRLSLQFFCSVGFGLVELGFVTLEVRNDERDCRDHEEELDERTQQLREVDDVRPDVKREGAACATSMAVYASAMPPASTMIQVSPRSRRSPPRTLPIVTPAPRLLASACRGAPRG